MTAGDLPVGRHAATEDSTIRAGRFFRSQRAAMLTAAGSRSVGRSGGEGLLCTLRRIIRMHREQDVVLVLCNARHTRVETTRKLLRLVQADGDATFTKQLITSHQIISIFIRCYASRSNASKASKLRDAY